MIRIEEIGLEVHDLVNGNIQYLDELIDLYLELLPDYARYVPIMRRRANRPPDATPLFIEHQWYVTINGEPAGMVIFKYNQKRNCGLGLDIGVSKKHKIIQYKQYSRLAHLLLDMRQDQLEQDAAKFGYPIPPVLGEIETDKVVGVFKGYGMYVFPVEYYEPPVTKESLDVIDPKVVNEVGFKRMHIGTYPVAGVEFDPEDKDRMADLVKAFLVDHYGLDEDHWVVQTAMKSINI